MRPNQSSTLRRSGWALLPLAFLLFGCDAETPTAPTAPAIPPVPNQPPTSSTFTITVSADPDELDINDTTNLVSSILVTARRSDTGQLVANGTTALLRTSLGTLTTSEGSTGASVAIVFDQNGQARATLNATSTVPTTVVVRAQIEQSFGSTNIRFVLLEPDPFQITGITPISGPPSGGTLLTITGSGFEAPVRVTFNVQGQTLLLQNVRVESSTRITARTPAIDLPTGQNALASLTLENGFDSTGEPSGTDTVSSAFTYTRNGGGGLPTSMKIFSLSPTSGPNEGGTRVTILGEGYSSQVQVYFTNGPLIEAQIVSLTATRLEVITPSATGPNASNANQRVSLRLVNSQTGESVTQTGAFQYGSDPSGLFVSSIAPGQDEYLGGTLVTIFGQGFEEPVAVSLGGFAQSIVSVTGTEIVVRTSRVSISCASVSAPTTVTNIETNENISNGPLFTYLPIRPGIVGVTPGSGFQDGGTLITISGGTRSLGRGFQAPLRVLINNVLANVVSVTPTEIVAVTPAFTGTFTTAPCTLPGPPPVTGTQNVPFAASVRVINLDTSCEDTLTGGFTYIPSDGTCHPPEATE
jgi:hypothetical protein